MLLIGAAIIVRAPRTRPREFFWNLIQLSPPIFVAVVTEAASLARQELIVNACDSEDCNIDEAVPLTARAAAMAELFVRRSAAADLALTSQLGLLAYVYMVMFPRFAWFTAELSMDRVLSEGFGGARFRREAASAVLGCSLSLLVGLFVGYKNKARIE